MWPHRIIQPEINPRGNQLSPAHIIILDVNGADHVSQAARTTNNPADQVLATLIVWMSLAAINQLDWANITGDVAQPFCILKQQVGTFVGTGATGKTDRQQFWIKLHAERPADFRE